LSPIEFKRMEIIDWWENERYRVYKECIAASERITKLAEERVEELSDSRLLVRNSRAMKCIQKQVDEKVEEFDRATVSSLQNSLVKSIDQVERSPESSGLNNAETAALAAGGVAAAGAGGLVVDTTEGGATTPAPVPLVFRVGSIVRPVVSAVKRTATTLAGRIIARDWRKRRWKKQLKQNIKQKLLAEADEKDPNSSWARFKMQIDDAALKRRDNLS